MKRCPPINDFLKFNVDEAARGKSDSTGTGARLRSVEGEVSFAFCK